VAENFCGFSSGYANGKSRNDLKIIEKITRRSEHCGENVEFIMHLRPPRRPPVQFYGNLGVAKAPWQGKELDFFVAERLWI
jgi:hypothetical protein